MKRLATRAAALALAAALAASPAALASVALGDEITAGKMELSQGTSLTSQVFWSNTYSDLRTEHYLTYTPSEAVTPIVAYGDKILSRTTLTALAQKLEQEGKRVLGGVNGDYYVLATGAPLGMVITDGILRSSDSYFHAVGFMEDGTVFIGKPELHVMATFGENSILLAGVNKVRTPTDGCFLLTEDFSATTQNTGPGVDVILTPLTDRLGEEIAYGEEGATLIQSDKLAVGGRVTCRVDQVLASATGVPIPAGSFVLTINNQSNAWLISVLSALQPGDTVDIDVTSPDKRWERARSAIGGMYKLVTGGVVEPGLENTQNPRSAVGVKADGTAVFYTIDGRKNGHSVGASLTQVAQRLAELGCVEAVCLDGGGSTTMGTTAPDANAMGIVNTPSDGTLRANSNAIFLVSNLTPTGVADHLYLTPGDRLVLAGAGVQMSARTIDSGWYPMEQTQNVAWAVKNSDGTITADGRFTAGAESGVSEITASAGSVTGQTSVTVVKRPDSIALLNEETGTPLQSLALSPGQVIDLKASAAYKKLALECQDTCFQWSADPAAGTVDANGVFTAAFKTAAGALTVSSGGQSLTVPVHVTGHILPLEDFELPELGNSFVGTDTAVLALQRGGAQVRYGTQSLKLSYDASGGMSTTALFLTPAAGERYLSLWIYGDGSGNIPSLSVTRKGAQDGTGTAAEDILLPALDYTGWRQVVAALPADTVSLSALHIIYGGSGPASGDIWLDQITTANEDLIDTTPPTVALAAADGQLTAAVTDNLAGIFEKSRISVALDGAAYSFQWDSAVGAATVTLPADDGFLHRLTVTATDVSGNIGRASYDLIPAAAQANPFSDTATHWAGQYAAYLYHSGVSTGISAGSGLQFQPDKNITRGEFFVMAARWLGLDLTAYHDIVLPFADAAAIPAWAADGVRAMYTLGILQGSFNDGVLSANAGGTISRAEAMTILGRMQARGYAEAELTFGDASAVPAWAEPYVRVLVGQGVVGGFENKITPQNPVTRGEVAKMLFALL